MKTSLILPVVIVIFITALARPGVAQQERPEDIAAQIRTEAVRSNFDPIGRPLPLVSAWGSMPDQIKLVEQGHFLVPAFWNKFVGTPEIMGREMDTWDSAYYQPEFKRAAELKLPVVFVTITGIIHAHESLLARPPYSDLPPAQNPMAFDAESKPLKALSPFGPVEHWRDLGRRWAAAERMKKVQEWYPDPPLIMFLSNNEMNVVHWHEAHLDARCPPDISKTRNQELKCKAVTDGFIERYRALQGAWREGLSAPWQKASKFVGYNAFGPAVWMGRFFDWQTRWSLQYKDRISPYPLMWDGGSPSYYGYGNNSNNRADGPVTELQNWVFMARDALKLNPNFWVEFSIWDGEDASPEIATKPNSIRSRWVEGRKEQYYKSLGLTYTAQHYAGFAQFGLWVLRPRMARWFGSHDRDWNATKPHFMALCDSVGRVHRDPVLRDWWRKGELVPNTTTPSPQSRGMEGPFEKEDRWFVLDTEVNPTFDDVKNGFDYGKTKYEVFSFALTRGSAGARQWLVYAYSPERDHSRVKLKIPRYSRAVTVDAPVGGAFYEVDERSSSVKFLPPPERLVTFASAQTTAPAASAPAAPAPPSPATPSAPPAPAITKPQTLPADALAFAGHHYKHVSEPGNWLDAKKKAEALGGHLVVITSAAENDWIKRTFIHPLEGGKMLWIGATNSGPDGKWKWVTGEEIGFTGWVSEMTASHLTIPNAGAGFIRAESSDKQAGWTHWNVRQYFPESATERNRGFIVEWEETEAMAIPAATPPAPPANLAQTPADPQLAALHTAWTARYDAEANKPFDTAIATLNTGYLRALENARAAAKSNGALAEVLALDTEKTQIGSNAGVPAADAADTPPALIKLRATYRAAHQQRATDRDARLKQLRAQHLKAIDTLIIDLTKANKIEEAKRAQQFRDELAK